jgi:hypothetical protein
MKNHADNVRAHHHIQESQPCKSRERATSNRCDLVGAQSPTQAVCGKKKKRKKKKKTPTMFECIVTYKEVSPASPVNALLGIDVIRLL